MAINIKVNGVNQNAFTRYKTLRIQKDGPIETLRVEFLDHDTTDTAFRPAAGDELHVDRDDEHLEFGGEITRVTDQRLSGLDNPSGSTDWQRGGGTVTIVEARGWYFEAADVKIPIIIFPPQGLYVTVEYLRIKFLSGKGWTNLEATTGGPSLPMLVYRDQTVADIFDDLTKKTGYPWRVNGEREMAFLSGPLPCPHTYDNSNSIVLRGATWSQQRVRRATRLLITTGGGGGEYFSHHEDHPTNGTKTHFPVNVLPPEVTGAINNVGGYAVSSTSLVIDGLPKSYTMAAGSTLRFGGHGAYQLTADATTDADGEATIIIAPGLSESVVDDEAITFGTETFVKLEVGGAATDLDGAPWSFDPEDNQFVTSGVAPSFGNVTYRTLVKLPTVVRVWTADAQSPDGSFDYGAVRDSEVRWTEYTDVVRAKEAGDSELEYRTEEPKELKISTFEQDVYPWMLATCSFPERLIDGPFTVQSVTLVDVGRRNQAPRVELTLLEGSVLDRNWRGFWRAKDSGAQLLSVPFPLGAPIIEQHILGTGAFGASHAISFSATPTVGNLAMFCITKATHSPAYPSTLADNQGNTWTKQVTNDGYPWGIEVWTAPITTASGAFSVTMSHLYNHESRMALLEISGANNAAPNHQSASDSKGFGSTTGIVDLPAITMPCLVIGVGAVTSFAQTAVPGAGWDLVDDQPQPGISVISKPALTPGTYDPTWTTNTPGFDMVGIAIRAA
jgi:hypothetical protein